MFDNFDELRRMKREELENLIITSISVNLRAINFFVSNYNCVKSVRIRSFSGPYFPAFGLNTGRYVVSLRIQSKCRKIRTRKTPNMDTFHAVYWQALLLTSMLFFSISTHHRNIKTSRIFCKVLF